MVAHQIKRQLRNRVVPGMADSYQRHLEASAGRLPAPSAASQIPLDLARFIGRYYEQDGAELDDAASGRFTLLGRTVDFGTIDRIDWEHRLPDETDHNLWRMKLTQLEAVHSLLASSEHGRHVVAVRLIEAISRHRSFASGAAFKTSWAPYGVSHRLLALLSGLAIAQHLHPLDAALRAQIEDFARLDAAFLWKNIEHDLRNNHTERNLAALCLYHMASGSITPAQAMALDRDIHALVDATVLPDGTQVERSAMYQGLTVMSLNIFAQTPFLRPATRALCDQRRAAAQAAWLFLTHSDGDIALFNDAWIGETPPPRAILGTEPMPADALPDGGYQRIVAGPVDALMDVGPIGPRWNPGHGHADFLAMEVDVAGRRLIVDPGTSQYSTGVRRTFERAAFSHNGPHYRGVEPVEYAGCFKVGRMIAAQPIDPRHLAALGRPAIGGILDTEAGRVGRIIVALSDTGALLAVDVWASATPAGRVRLMIPADWQMQVNAATIRSGDGQVAIDVLEGRVESCVEEQWSRRFMAPEPAVMVTIAATALSGGGQASALLIGAASSHNTTNIYNSVIELIQPLFKQ